MNRPDDSRPSRRPRGVVPYNPDLQALIKAKNQWQNGPDERQPPPGFKLWNQRGYLPHRDAPGLLQFVMFHLADCFPAQLRSEWEALLKIEDDCRRHQELEEYLDKGHGECYLRRPELADLVEGAFRCFHNVRYELHAWVVMPNHVHVLFTH